MNWVVATVITSLTSFLATNLDDLLILIVFFSRTNPTFRDRHILVGHTLGLMALVLASLPGFLGGLLLPDAWIGLLGIVPIAIGLHQLRQSEAGSDTVQTVSQELEASQIRRSPTSWLASLFVPQTYHVAAVTFANGGDNIGIYVPLFANSDWLNLLMIISLFLVFSFIWCAGAYAIARHPKLTPLITRYGQPLVPWILIGLGGWILIENGSYQLLFPRPY